MALLAICLGYFMVILDATALTVALPALRTDLGGDVSTLQWVVDAYALTFAACLLSGGALGDRLGSRRVFAAGLALFILASAACGAAPSAGALVGARAVQGIGAALTVPASLALLQAAYSDRRARARAVGIWGGIAGIAAAGGPIVGGALVSGLSWRAVFFVNVPIGLAALALTARRVPAAPRNPERGLDPPAQLAAVVALGALTFGLIEAGSRGWGSPVVLAALACAPVAAVGFVAWERRSASPMLPLTLFRSAGFSGASAVGLLLNLGFYGQLFVVNLYFQQVRGLSALQTGAALLPEAGLVALASTASGRLTGRLGSPRPTMLAGLLTGAAGLCGLALTARHTPYPLLVAPLAATGVGIALTMPAATTAVLEAVPPAQAGVASGVLNAARQVGGAIGVALLGTLVAGGAGFIPGLRTGLVVASAAYLGGAAITALCVDRGVRLTGSPTRA